MTLPFCVTPLPYRITYSKFTSATLPYGMPI